jgi:PAS domain S-box-containing protein
VTEEHYPAPFRSRAARALALASLLIVLFVVALAWRSLRADRQAAYESASQSAANLAQVLGENLEGTIAQVDLALLAAADALEAPGALDATRLPRTAAVVARITDRIPLVDSIRATDAGGTVIFGKGVDPRTRIDVKDRDYFRASRADPEHMAISSPLIGRISHKWSIILGRTYHRPDGAFAGVVFASVSTEKFTRTLARARAPHDGAIVLRGGDNAAIARYPDVTHGESVIGQRKISDRLQEILASGVAEATFVAISPVEHKETANAFRRVGEGPFYLLVVASQDAFLVGWRSEVRRTSLAIALFALLLGLAAWVLLGSLRRESEARFRALVLEAPIAVFLTRGTRIVYVNRTFGRTFGLADVRDAVGRSLADLLPPGDVPRVAERIDRRMRALPVDPTIELTLLRQEGGAFRAVVTDAAVEFDGGPAVVGFIQDVTEQRRSAEERERLIGELRGALAEVKTLSGLLPICAHCKKIRDDRGYWSRIETYIRERSNAEFTHGICPDCAQRYFDEDADPSVSSDPKG